MSNVLKKRTVERALPIVASVYADKLGVKIRVGGDKAYTDGKVIQIPSIPPEYADMDSIYGFLAHEAAHVKYTKFEYFRKAVNEGGAYKRILNILEDGRIETAIVQDFKGVGATLNSALDYYISLGKMGMPADDESPADVFMNYLLFWMRARWRDQSQLQPVLEAYEEQLKKHYSMGVYTALQNYLREAASVNSTKGVYAVVEKMIQMLKDEQKKEEEKRKEQEQNQDDQNQSGDDQDQDDSQDQDGGQDQGDGDEDGDGQGGNSLQNQGDSQDDSSDSSASGSQPSSQKGDAEKALEALLNGEGESQKDVFNGIAEQLKQTAQDTGGDGLPSKDDHIGKFRGSLSSDLNNAAKAALAASNQLRPALTGFVQGELKVPKALTDQGTRLNQSRISRVVAGDTKVFQAKRKKKRTSAAVHVLVDVSSSMNSQGRMAVANDATVAVANALDGINNVDVAVSTFGDYTTEILGLGKPVRRHLSAIANMRANGTTHLGPALWHAAENFVKTKHDRKLVIVITDGMPYEPNECNNLIGLMNNSGISVCGVGVQTQEREMKRVFNEFVQINDLANLKNELFKISRAVA